MAWHIGNGRSIQIRRDPWAGSHKNFRLSEPLITKLSDRGVRLLEDESTQTEDHRGTTWKTTQELGLEANEEVEWNTYKCQLGNNFIQLREEKDKLI